MMLIDADALMRIYQEVLCPHVSCADCSLLTNDGNCRFETMIREALAIDAVSIVRCRDCKYWHKETLFCDYMPYVEAQDRVNWYADDFCSYGERKDGDGNG